MAKAHDNLLIMLEIATERERQVTEEGFTPDNDHAKNRDGELAIAAGCYLLHGQRSPLEPPRDWPWHPFWWRPKTRRRDLIRAAALIVAELERLETRQELEKRRMEEADG